MSTPLAKYYIKSKLNKLYGKNKNEIIDNLFLILVSSINKHFDKTQKVNENITLYFLRKMNNLQIKLK